MTSISDLPKVNGFLNIGDQHLSFTPPGHRKPGYAGQVLRKIAAAIEICNKQNLVPLFAGDMFDSPVENSETIKTILQEILKKSNNMPITNVGNHDKKSNKLAKSDTLSVIGAGQTIKVIDKLTVPGEELLYNVNGKIVAVGFSPYGTDIPDDLSHFDNGADRWIWMTHHDLAFEGVYPGAIEPFPIKKCDLVLNGHMHMYKDPVVYGGTVWCNFGSIARTSRDLVNEIPSVFEVTPDMDNGGFKFTRHRLPFLPPEEAFNMVGRQVDAVRITADDLRSLNQPENMAPPEQGSVFVASLAAEMAPGQMKTGSGQLIRDEFSEYMDKWKTPIVVKAEIEGLLDAALQQGMSP